MATSQLSDTDNWMLAAVGLKYLKEGLEEFTDQNLKQQHDDFLSSLHSQTGQCFQCTIDDILPSHYKTSCRSKNCFCRDKKRRRLCPVGQCSQMHDLIVSSHRTGEPTWTNTDPRQWYINHISVGTCFINTPGYKMNRSISEIDCAGILSILINNKFFDQVLGGGGDIVSSGDFKRVRDVRNEIFHEPNLRLLSGKMQSYIRLFIKILTVPKIHKTPAAQAALEKLKKIQSGDYLLSQAEEDDLLKLRQKATSEIEAAASVALKKIDVSEKRIDTKIEQSVAVIAQTSQQALAEVEEMSQRLSNANERRTSESSGLLAPFSEWWQKRNLKRDLITYYRHEFNTLSISPLFQKNDAPLLQLYATPSLSEVTEISNSQERLMETYEIHTYRVGKSMKMIESLKDVFIDSKRSIHCVYVTADAGYGKTSFAKKLLIDWCQSQKPVKSDTQFYQECEVALMKHFDYLFFVPLRKYREVEQLDDMLHSQLVNCLHHRYTKSFLKNILENKHCLIILDGLDEWMPSESRSESEVPEWKYRNTCSIIITTRHWKFSSLSPQPTDVHVEMSGLSVADSRWLACRAISFLNKKYGTDKSSDIFCSDLVEHNLHDIVQVPLLLMQCLCLWYDGKSLGQSHCEIYFNLIELLSVKNKERLNPWVRKSAGPHNIDIDLPDWFRKNPHCCSQFHYLVALGKLSFFTLFGKDRTASLVFDEAVADMYITPDELAFGKNVGLLSIEKSYGTQSSRHCTISFIHKTYQEILAALYIASQRSKSYEMYNTISQYCSSVENILAMWNVFKFLCGLSTEMFEHISKIFTPVLKSYNRHLFQPGCDKLLLSYQKMILKCHEAACLSDKEIEHDFKLFDIFLNDSVSEDDLKSLQHTDKTGVVSLNMSSGTYSSLRSEIITGVLRNSVDLQQLDLRPSSFQHDFNILDIWCVKNIQSMSLAHFEISQLDLTPFIQLEFVYLHAIKMLTHIKISPSLYQLDLEDLIYLEELDLSACKNLNQLHLKLLQKIKRLDLSACTQLQQVHMRHLQDIKQLCLPSCNQLQQLHFEDLRGIGQLDLSSCKQLQNLHLEIVPVMKQLDLYACTQLQHLHLENLPEAKKLDLSACTQLQQLHIKDLQEIKSLDLSACTWLQDLHLEVLTGLEQLELSACKRLQQLYLEYLWALTEFELLPFTQLRQLHLEDLQGINNVDLSFCTCLEELRLKRLQKIKHLDVSACIQLRLLHVKYCQGINQLDLSVCAKLENLYMTNLHGIKQLRLSSCTQLQHLHMENLHRLKELDLSGCIHLQDLHLNYLRKMKHLELSKCTQLQRIHLEYLWKVKQLDISACLQIQQLHMKGLQDMTQLDLSIYTRLQQLHLEDLKGRKLLDLSACTHVQQLHLKDLQGMKQLALPACTQRQHLQIKVLHLENVKEMKKLYLNCTKLYQLYLKNLQGLQELQMSADTQLLHLENIQRLENLDLSVCAHLQQIHLDFLPDIIDIDLSACTHLQQFNMRSLNRIKQLDLSACLQLQQLYMKDLQEIDKLELSACSKLQVMHLEDLKKIERLNLSACTLLQQFYLKYHFRINRPDIPAYLQWQQPNLCTIKQLDLSACTHLQQLHLSGLREMKVLDLSACRHLQQLHLEILLELKQLDLSACRHIQQLRLKDVCKLEELDLSACTQLQELHLENTHEIQRLDLSVCRVITKLYLESLQKLESLNLSSCTDLQETYFSNVPISKPDLSHCPLLTDKHLTICFQ